MGGVKVVENNEMLEAYLFEANTLLEELDEILLNCEKQTSFDADSINTIFRIMHTIKGSSAMMEYASLATVSHKIEDLFSYVRENGMANIQTDELFDLMFKSSDFLKSEIYCIEKNVPLSNNIGNFEAYIDEFLKNVFENNSDSSLKPALVPTASVSNNSDVRLADNSVSPVSVLSPESCKDSFCHAVRIFFDEDAQMEHLRAFMIVNALNETCSNFKYEPSNFQAENCSNIINQNGFMLYFESQSDVQMCLNTIEHFVFIKKYELLEQGPSVIVQDTPTQQKDTISKDGQAEIQNPSSQPTSLNKANAPSSSSSLTNTTSLINVNLTKLDNLMDLMGEIVITESMVTSIPSENGVDIESFTKAARQLQKLTDELQESVMAIRMVPVNSVFQKMRRIVRDMSKKLDKDVELLLEGEDTEVDKTIVDSIGDPIMHLVRNAMDHGIETKEERIANGKSESGKITLSAENTGGEILVSVRDDGKGFDRVKILEKARDRGLLRKPKEEYSAKEAFAFLMMPGFSTKEKVTEFSGRGVGMDVVKKNIEKIGGDVILDSEKGKGSVVIFKIPLTLAIVTGMEISVGGSLFTIPINNIRQTFKIDQNNILYDTDQREIIMIRNQYYPLLRLHNKFNISTQVTDLTEGIILLVESNDTSYCILADRLIGEHQVVIKQLPIYLNKFQIKEHGVAGCAILGDGSISLILDVLSLYNNTSSSKQMMD